MAVDWSSLWKKEDWWANYLGFLFMALVAAGLLKKGMITKPAKWLNISKAIMPGTEAGYIIMLVVFLLITLIGIVAMKLPIGKYVVGFILMYVLVFLCFILGSFKPFLDVKLEYPLWALAIGLFISNVLKVPEWMKPAIQTEYYIKIGLVILGAEVIFGFVLKAGALGILQSLLVVFIVWYCCYFIAIKMGVRRTFAATLATGVSICGVSASIAAGGAVKGDPKETAYTISLVLLFAVPMLILEPYVAYWVRMSEAVAGAWIGGTIDTTGAVVAAGGLVGDFALQVAALVKMAQNVLIGFTAFILAVWSTLRWERKPGEERPSYMEIWYRFPKFILGFIVASIIFSTIVGAGIWTDAQYAAFKGVTKLIRTWMFCFAFLGIGLGTNFKELVKIGGGKPFYAYTIAQIFNIFWTLVIAYILWSGVRGM